MIERGSSVNVFQTGDQIFGTVGRHHHPCAYAQYCVVKPSEMVLKPDYLNVEQAAALPTAGLTAWQALHTHGKLMSGERVLIHAAAGGVGHLAVQMAKSMGAYVIATASARHHDFLDTLGVDQIVDYTRGPFESAMQNIDLVIDLVGGKTGIASLKVLNLNGRLVTVPTVTRDQILQQAAQQHIKATGMLAEVNQENLLQLVKIMAQYKIQLHIASTFSVADAAKAHQLLEEKHTAGKIVLTTEKG